MAAKGRKARILVADDDPSLRSFLKTALAYWGYAVTLCADGASALKRAGSGGFDLLLLDFRMGPPTGFDVLKSLRNRGMQVPVVIMSSHLPEDIRVACSGLRNTSVLHKPFSVRILRKILIRHLATR